MHKEYHPPPTINRFHLDDNFVRVIVGPYGSAKTYGMIMELVKRSVEQEPDAFGVRNTRWAIVRQTRPQIVSTILPEIMQAIGPLVSYHPSKSNIAFNVELDDGTRTQSEWLLMPLEEVHDQRRLLSLNLTGAWCSELRELNYELVQSLLGRMGRFPAVATQPPTWFGMFGESNPWSVTSKWHEHLVRRKPENWSLYRQPGGLDPQAENLHNLVGGREYYERLIAGASQEWVDVHVHAKWGTDKAGQPVYSSTFDPAFHVSSQPLPVNPNKALLIFQDFGRTPAALIAQVTPDERLHILSELTCYNMGIELFVSSLLIPHLRQERFANFPTTMVADPAGQYADQAGEESLFDIVARLGLNIVPAPTDRLEPRIRAVEAALLQQRGGKPLIRIDGHNCPLLIQAMETDYKFAVKKDGEIEEKPRKTHPASDLADDLGYGCLHVFGSQISQQQAHRLRRGRAGRPFTGRPPFSAVGWT